ncbi:MAG: sugar phosphate isomerase/epimerase [Defluviitaleaceae bacterium]|nr:sugar phosphate isomerase/epimerase [Defluviitaleaceae bacterium]
MNPVSIASYSFHKLLENKMIDIYGYLESLRYRYNLLDADIWNGYLLDMEKEDFKKIRAAMDERGLTLASLCCDWCNIWCADPDEGAKCDANAEKFMDAAEILGARTVRMDVGVPADDITGEQYEAVRDKYAAYAKRGAKAGFVIGPENHWGASRRMSLQKRLYKDINSPNYGMLLHLGNWNLEDGQSLAGNDAEAAAMAVHTHVAYEMAQTADSWLANVLAAGYKGALSVEHHKEIAEYRGTQAQLGALQYAISKL